MLSEEEQIKLGARLLGIPYEDAKKYSTKIENSDAIYLSIPIKGGDSLIIGADGQVLYAISALSFSEHLDAYNKGKRTPLEAFDKYTSENANS